jgi:glycosyltransferase involved in cell wall biosynthesis
MHIGIDGRMTNWSGIGRYSRNVLKKIVSLDRVNHYTVFCRSEDLKEMPTAKNFAFTETNASVFAVSQRSWEKIVARASLDLFYTPYVLVPFRISCRSVGTIHDLIPWRIPGVQQNPVARFLYRPAISRAVPNFDHILVDSFSTREDVVNFLGIPDERISVIPAAADDCFGELIDEERTNSVCRRYGIEGDFILNVGTARPHKNLPFLIKVFKSLVEEKGLECRLVFAGADDKWRPDHRRLVADLGVGKNVIFAGRVSDDVLVAFYNRATLCAFPSLFEGFGLPALEAMVCGSPVICSNNSSLAEIVGEAGILLDCRDRISWIDALEGALRDESLRESMRTKGLERAKQFSWEKTTRSILEVFEEVGMSRELRA